MASTNLLLGLFFLIYGAATLIARFVAPNSFSFRKLEAMKKAFGDSAGNAVHWAVYTVLPLVAGIVLLVSQSKS